MWVRSITCHTVRLAWGYPYLVTAEGLSPVAAGEVLSALVVGGIAANPVVGAVTARRRGARMPIVGGYLVVAVVTWAVLLGVPGHLPAWALGVAFAVLALGQPISAVGFALARDYNPLHRVGTATGVVNVGGFTATTVAALSVGVLVGLGGSGAAAYRVGLLAVVAVLLVGSWRTAVWLRRARAAVFAAQRRGEAVPVPLRVRRWDSVPEPARA